MAGMDLTAAAPILKEHYEPFTVKSVTYPESPLYARLKKKTDFDGKVLPLPIRYGNPQSASATASVAFGGAQNTSTSYVSFGLVRGHEYGDIYLDRETLKACRDNTGAFVDVFVNEGDRILKQVGRRLGIAAYRDGNGWIGQGDSAYSVAGPTIQLASIKQVNCFEKGQVLQFGATKGGAVRVGTLTVSSINRRLGQVTCATNVTAGIAAAVNSDFIFINGDALNGGTFGKVKMVGLQGWIPDADPTGGDNFFGVDRSVDPQRLAGQRYDATSTGASVKEALFELMALICEAGGHPNACYVPYTAWLQLVKDLDTKVIYGRGEDEAGAVPMGFRTIELETPDGIVSVIMDNCAIDKRAYMLQEDVWGIYSLGEAPEVIDEDGLEMLRNVSLDGFDQRVAAYPQMGCEAPAWNGVAILN